jgi:hypothetical protein
VRHDAKRDLHLILNLQGAEHRAEGRKSQLALPQPGRAAENQRAGAELVAHRHGEAALPAAYRGLHLRQQRARDGRRRSAGRAAAAIPGRAGIRVEIRLQHDLGKFAGIEQRLAEHVVPRALFGALGHVGRKVGAGLLRAQRRLIYAERRHGNVDLAAAAPDVGRHVDAAAQLVRGDHVVVTDAGECATAVDQDGEQRCRSVDVVRLALQRRHAGSLRGRRRRGGGRDCRRRTQRAAGERCQQQRSGQQEFTSPAHAH